MSPLQIHHQEVSVPVWQPVRAPQGSVTSLALHYPPSRGEGQTTLK